MQILTSTLLKIPLVSDTAVAQPLSSELIHCPLVRKARGRKREYIEKKRQSENEDFLTNLHGSSNLIFPQGAASLNLSEFKFNEKYSPVRSEKSVASCRDGCFGNR